MIIRQPLREQIYETLLENIEKGAFRPGERLRDVNVAQGLRVSRTPVREAFLRLEQEGIVTTVPGYGFSIRTLSVQEIRDKYPILSSLECLAMKSSPPLTDMQLAKLSKLNESMSHLSGSEQRMVDLDEEWHSLLLSNCDNKTLLKMIAGLKTNLRRYELAYMRDVRRITVSTEHHYRIIQALADGDMETALDWLNKNWIQTTDDLAEWLMRNKSKSETSSSNKSSKVSKTGRE